MALNHGAVRHGSVVIAAITSCTNTSNPAVMLAAGLLAKKAVEAGLDTKPWVKTSLAPGSRVVTEYLDAAGLTPYLDKLGFSLVGFGCTTCIGNSGPLPEEVADAVTQNDLAVVAVLSGNRNFEGRIHPLVRASYLASPPLVVAYALAGHVEVDLSSEPLGTSADGTPVSLKDLWPTPEEVRDGDRGVGLARTVRARVRADLRRRRPVARPPHARGSGLRVGSELDLRARAAVLRGPRTRRRPNPPTSPARAASSRSGTRSRPITSRRRARSNRTRPPGGTCSTTASSSATSTRTARGEATTR